MKKEIGGTVAFDHSKAIDYDGHFNVSSATGTSPKYIPTAVSSGPGGWATEQFTAALLEVSSGDLKNATAVRPNSDFAVSLGVGYSTLKAKRKAGELSPYITWVTSDWGVSTPFRLASLQESIKESRASNRAKSNDNLLQGCSPVKETKPK